MVLTEDLRHRIVTTHVQHDVVDADDLWVHELVPGSRRGGWHLALQDEHAVGGQVAGGVLEAPDLVVLGEQVAVLYTR